MLDFKDPHVKMETKEAAWKELFSLCAEGGTWHPGWESGCYAMVHSPGAEPFGVSL